MKLPDYKIRNLLLLGFATIFLFVCLLGAASVYQATSIQKNLETMYQHPLQVRRALANFKLAVADMQIAQFDLLVVKSDEDITNRLEKILTLKTAAHSNLETVKSLYLGKKSDIDDIESKYNLWLDSFDNDTALLLSGNNEEFFADLINAGRTQILKSNLESAIKVTDDFAVNKTETLYGESIVMKNTLNAQMTGMIILILLFSLIISFNLLKLINTPLKIINQAVMKFHDGDYNARISYLKNNEFGVISRSINLMADKVVADAQLSDKIANVNSILMGQSETEAFYLNMLSALMEQTKSMIGVIYIRDEANQIFKYKCSIGINNQSMKDFNCDAYDNEFGLTLSTKKISIVDYPQGITAFKYSSLGVEMVPNQLMTVPLLATDSVYALIALATNNSYQTTDLTLVERLMPTLSARMASVDAYDKIVNYKEHLEIVNKDLFSHKQELAAQAIELIQQNTELEVQKNQLNEASKLKSNFLSNMSHELRTPLNSVIALSGILSRHLANTISPTDYNYLEIIERNGKNLLEMINDILDLSRIEANRDEVHVEQFDLGVLINDIIEMLSPQSNNKGIKLSSNVLPGQLLLNSDIRKCRHILQNLIGNAVKFTSIGSVTVSAQIVSSKAIIKVEDTGIGISPENINHIFDEFRQADGTTARKYGGTGLGLAIAKKYALLLDGDIKVSSVIDVGSTFTLELPITLSVVEHDIFPTQKNSFSSTDLMALKNKAILVVDDNDTALIQIKDLLVDTDITVMTANNALDAFKQIEQRCPDAIVLDLMMPDIDGFKMLELLRNAEATAHVPVLILTAKHLTKSDLQSLKRNNVHQLILKGAIERNSLQNAISNLLISPSEQLHKEKKSPATTPIILIAEDNKDNMTTTKALVGDKYRVIEATDGLSAVDLAKAAIPNLILMDIALPGIDGIEAFKQIRSIKQLSSTPVIAFTANALKHDKDYLLKIGFDGYLSKPINIEEFNAYVQEFIYGKLS